MAKQTKRRRTSKKRRPDFFKKYRLPLILMGGASLVLVLLIFFARLQEQPQVKSLPKVTKPQLDASSQVRTEIEAMISALDLDASKVQRDLDHTPVRYSIDADYPSSELVDLLESRLDKIPGGYTVRWREANSLTIEKSRRTEFIVHFLPPAPEFPPGPLMTVIMDDLGRTTHAAEVLVSLPEPVTFAILPDEPNAVRVAEMAHAAGHEVMLHVPMEPQGYPAVNPGKDALFVKYDEAEIRARLDGMLAKIPHVTGGNNHMGSRFTESAEALAPVMQSFKERGLFFVDSRTTGHSKVSAAAHQAAVPTINRDVFLDNVADVDAIVREIKRLENKARKQGMAIGICHPYPETLEALRRELPAMKARGINVVPVSVLLQKQASVQGS